MGEALQFYVENNCPPACSPVSIIELAEKYRKERNCAVPILAVDGMSVLLRLYRMDGMDWLYGGQWRQIVHNLNTFVSRFREERIKLVFYFEGSTQVASSKAWIAQRLKNLGDVKKIFEHLSEYQTKPDDSLSQFPSSMGTYLRYALKSVCQCSVINSVVDVKQELAIYVMNTSECFAVLGQHIDYLIFPTKPFLSVGHLKLGTLVTNQYSRFNFANSLGLTIRQLPLLSCLLGNNYVPVESLQSLHQSLTEAPDDPVILVSKVAKFMNSQGWKEYLDQYTTIRAISQNIKVSVEVLSSGIHHYGMSSKVLTENVSKLVGISCPVFMFQVRLKHKHCEMNPGIYNIMSQQEFKLREGLEDEETTGLKPSSAIFRSLRRRFYAVLFTNRPDKVEEMSAIQGSPILSEQLTPEPFDVCGLPQLGIELLWSKNVSSEGRCKTFLKGIGIALTQIQLESLPDHLLGFACLLNFLLLNPIGDPDLEIWEVDALIAQAVSPLAEQPEVLSDLTVTVAMPRAIHLATIVIRGTTMILGFLQVCGLHFRVQESFMPWNFFDGKLMHQFYLASMHGASVEDLLQRNEKAIQDFHHLKSVVFTGKKDFPITPAKKKKRYTWKQEMERGKLF